MLNIFFITRNSANSSLQACRYAIEHGQQWKKINSLKQTPFARVIKAVVQMCNLPVLCNDEDLCAHVFFGTCGALMKTSSISDFSNVFDTIVTLPHTC
jgi:hypothetical protein